MLVPHQSVLEHLALKCELFHVAQGSVREIYPLAAVRHHRKSALKEPGLLEELTIFGDISSESS